MKERFFYKKTELITEINAVREYPFIQIFEYPDRLIEDKSEYITDKYNRIGNLINIGDLYLFQPLEIKNKKISVFERSNQYNTNDPPFALILRIGKTSV